MEASHRFNRGGARDPEATCTRCGLKAKNEYKKPVCKRAPMSEPIPAKGKGDKPKDTSKKKLTGYSGTGFTCYESHPVLDIGGGVFAGGSCGSPVVKDADIYIGFQSGMRKTDRRWPWNPGEEVSFPVTDYHAPSAADTEEYIKLVDWAVSKLAEGKKVHAGCIGGHGRTGMFLAAILGRLGYEKPIAYAREHYCKKAVESTAQVKFLAKHFGCEADADGAKSFSGNYSGKNKHAKDWQSATSGWSSPIEKYRDRFGTPKALTRGDEIVPTPTSANVWGRTLDEEEI